MPLNWTATKEEHELISAIADRAMEAARGARAGDLPEFGKMDLMMDLEAVHCNGCPLQLQDLLNAPPFDFAHDLGGIRRHLNRETGKLENCFLPRYAVPERERSEASLPKVYRTAP